MPSSVWPSILARPSTKVSFSSSKPPNLLSKGSSVSCDRIANPPGIASVDKIARTAVGLITGGSLPCSINVCS